MKLFKYLKKKKNPIEWRRRFKEGQLVAGFTTSSRFFSIENNSKIMQANEQNCCNEGLWELRM